MVITVATLVTLLLIAVVAIGEVVASHLPDILLQGLGRRAPQAAVYLVAEPPDAAGGVVSAARWLRARYRRRRASRSTSPPWAA
jgi:hypothetical protein